MRAWLFGNCRSLTCTRNRARLWGWWGWMTKKVHGFHDLGDLILAFEIFRGRAKMHCDNMPQWNLVLLIAIVAWYTYGNSRFNFGGKLHDCFSWQLHHFIFPPAMHKSSHFSTSSPTLAIFFTLFIFLKNNSHPNKYVVVSHSGFDLNFTND